MNGLERISLILILAVACFPQEEFSPLWSSGDLDFKEGVLQGVDSTGHSGAWCAVGTKCNNESCTESMSVIGNQAGSSPGGAIIQLLPFKYCGSRRRSLQDSVIVFIPVTVNLQQKEAILNRINRPGKKLSWVTDLPDSSKARAKTRKSKTKRAEHKLVFREINR